MHLSAIRTHRYNLLQRGNWPTLGGLALELSAAPARPSMENSITRFASRLPAVMPLIFSASALLLSLLSFRLTDVRSVKPVLTITFENESGWNLNNIGNGPALNVIVSQRPEGGIWSAPVRVP